MKVVVKDARAGQPALASEPKAPGLLVLLALLGTLGMPTTAALAQAVARRFAR
jgi:hypothetical protein